jgi:hypothetical protein
VAELGEQLVEDNAALAEPERKQRRRRRWPAARRLAGGLARRGGFRSLGTRVGARRGDRALQLGRGCPLAAVIPGGGLA